jgi:hypothetical protein
VAAASPPHPAAAAAAAAAAGGHADGVGDGDVEDDTSSDDAPRLDSPKRRWLESPEQMKHVEIKKVKWVGSELLAQVSVPCSMTWRS